MIEKLKQSDFTLVLSGGGALGIAHLGVLSDLERENITPKEIVGTSMGGIIGACMAIGMSENEIEKQIKQFSSIHNWIKFSYASNALINNKKIAKIFDSLFGDKKICETDIPLKLIATNLQTGEKRVFDARDDVTIRDAVLCTMAIPGVFDEHTIDGHIYGDGFLCENLGINEASYKTILAVDVLGKNSFDEHLPDSFFKTSNVLSMFERSMRLLIYNQSSTHIQNSTKNIHLIEPKTSRYKTFDFHKSEEIKVLGLGLLE